MVEASDLARINETGLTVAAEGSLCNAFAEVVRVRQAAHGVRYSCRAVDMRCVPQSVFSGNISNAAGEGNRPGRLIGQKITEIVRGSSQPNWVKQV